MLSRDAFRRKLQRHLIHIGEARERACAGQPSGADLKVIARAKALATEASGLSPKLCNAIEATLSDPIRARRFAVAWAALPEALGSTVWPRDLAELVSWLIDQARPFAPYSRRVRACDAARRQPEAERPDGRPGLAAAVAGDFTGSLAVVAPMLAVWEVSAGIGQWHAGRFAAEHAATLASIVGGAPEAGDRGISPVHPATLAFVPTPGAPLCHAAVDLGAAVPVGATISVVPRSATCAAPLVPAAVGDPITSFGLATAFAVAGLASLKAWCWLRVRSAEAQSRSPTLHAA